MMTRRTFMSALGVLSAAGGLGVGIAAHTRRRLEMADLRPALVLPLRGAAVTLQAANGSRTSAVVTDVTAVHRPADGGAPGTEQISLLVKPSLATPLGGTYRVRSADLDLGRLDFSAVGPSGSRRRLEAVITRIV